MITKNKTLALLLVLLILTSLALLPHAVVKAQSATNSAPAIQWQKEYGDSLTAFVSNLIQTSDGGYAFLDLGWEHSVGFQPATIYKIDSLGSVQWTETINSFAGSTIIQTNDTGYEISGFFEDSSFLMVGGTAPSLPLGYQGSIIKTDSQGNIQWIENYTSTPPILTITSSKIQASDGGLAYIQASDGGLSYLETWSIIKADSSNYTHWTKELTFQAYNSTYSIALFSLIETSDGAIAVLGVGNPSYGENLFGNIYLTKTEPFLPKPSPTLLPTPIQTPIITVSKPVLTPVILAVALVIGIVVSSAVGLLLYRRHRKTKNK